MHARAGFDRKEHQRQISFKARKLPDATATTPEVVRSAVNFTTLRSQMHKLGHDHIDILKIDIEGNEENVVQSLSKHELASIGQLQIELHLDGTRGREATVRQAERMLAPLEKAGFRVFQSEPNWLRPPKLELSLIHRSWDPCLFS
jgi:hypothetical protein